MNKIMCQVNYSHLTLNYMFICEMWLFDWYFPQFCKSDMSKYGYLEVIQGSLRLRDNESRLYTLTCEKNLFRGKLIPDCKSKTH